MTSTSSRCLLLAASALGAAGLIAFAGAEAPLRILGIQPQDQRDRVAFATNQDDHYYVLRRGDTLAAIGNPVDLKVAPRGTNLLDAVRSSATTGFYKVERVPVSAPVDSDGDGANDLLELDFQPYRSPLTPADALLIPPAILDPLPEQTTNDTVTVTGRAWPGTVLTIAGGSSVVSGAVAQAGTYNFNVNLRPNRVNKLFLTSGDGANASAPVALAVVQDREPPTLFVDFPSTGSETIEPTTTLAGRVGDVLSGALGLSVTVNGQPAAVAIGLGQNGTFDKPSLPLALGTNTFTIVARDALGNQTTRTHTVVRKTPGAYRIERVSGDAQFAAVHTLVPQPLAVRVIDGNGQPFADKLVEFQVTRSDGELLPGPSFNLPRTRAYQVRTDEAGLARAWWLLGGTAGCAADRVEATSAGVDGKATFCATARPGPASQINIGSGNNQIAEVGAPAPQTLRAWVNDSCNGIVNLPVTFTVTEGNGAVNGQSSVTVNTGPTGHAEVQFRLATDGTRNAVEATFAGNPGLPTTFTATGRIRNALQPTVFRGLVLDNANQPLGGAQVWAYVNGQAFPTVNTDAQGFFELTDLPAGAGSLFVDGAFATQLYGQIIPMGSFPSLSYEVVVTANTVNELPTPVRLPRLDPANSVVFNNSQDVILRCAGIEGLELKVKAGSMRKADGSLVSPGNLAILSLNQVHHDEVPMPMPDGASPPFAWTLQPGGATFNPPIEITYPNMSGLAPGATAYFLTYNHALEQFQIVSSGQVSEDGLVIKSDPGSGLNLAGWGCNCPPYSVTGSCCKEAPPGGCKICQDGKLVNAPDGTPADDKDDCTTNDRCQQGVAKGDSPAGTAACANATTPEFRINYIETRDLPGGNFERLDGVDVNGSVCFDGTAKAYRYQVVTHGYHGAVNLTLVGSTEPNPVPGGNVTSNNYCAILAGLANYSGPSGGRGEWHTLAASRAHEEHHRDVDSKRAYDTHAPSALSQLAGLQVSCQNARGPSVLESQAAAIICQFEANVFREDAAFASAHNAQTSDGAYQAGQAVLDQMIQRIQGFASTQGWPACANIPAPAPLPGLAPIRLVALIPTPAHVRLAPGQVVQLGIQGEYSDATTTDLTSGATGTTYSSRNPGIATVSANGLVRAMNPGPVNIVVTHSPGQDLIPILTVVEVMVIAPDDRDGDFMPNDWENTHGFNPDDAADGALDADNDGLDNLGEFLQATDAHNPDTDGDGLPDGLEVANGQDPLAPLQLDAAWRVSVNGQSVTVNPDGSFLIPNVSAPDQFGAGGPGTQPDFLSDDVYRIVGQATFSGQTWYAFTDPMQFRAGEAISVPNLVVTSFPPPTPASIRVAPDLTLLTSTGQTTRAQVIATLLDGATTNVSSRSQWTTYRISNPAVASVSTDGIVTARARGSVYVSAFNEGATAVARIEVRPGVGTGVVEGYVRTADGQPVVGALVSVSAVPGEITTQTGGKFIFPSVPLDASNLVFNASFSTNLVGFITLTGLVRPGTNDAGVIVVAAPSAPEGMALIPAGEFQMGDSLDSLSNAPVHPVYVSAFYMDKYEVTKALWDEVRTWALANGYTFSNTGLGKAANHPVHTVNWHDCVKWCNARSEKAGFTPSYYTNTVRTLVYRTGEVNLAEVNVNWTGGGYRLPTEAEWEKAARGGMAGQRFPWGATITHTLANYQSSISYAYDTSPTRNFHPTYGTGSTPFTSPVGSFAANGYGLFDMAGNLWEWNWDLYSASYYASSPGTDPLGPTSGTSRVLRGGAWVNYAYFARCANRSFASPATKSDGYGFRCAR